ncbi:hypothetical protein [Streptomyces sp. NPDC046727]|uniref:hypothetical protein n=1 Tax=Streptomyces sp. NPDC046727 TaxID=3155373 RepID=UPI0033D10F6A
MPEESTKNTATTPATAPATAPAPAGSGAARALGFGCLGVGGLVLLFVLCLVVSLVWNAQDGTDLPRVAPEEMASRAFRNSQEAYDVLGFTRTVPPGVERHGVGTENTLGAQYCYDGGLLGLEDKTVDGAYGLYHDWALDHVPASQAVPGLRRLHQRLKEDGWEVSSYTEGGKSRDWSLFVHRDGEGRMDFSWDPDTRYFTGGAAVPCAYDPGWTGGGAETYDPDDAADSVTTPALGPR